MDGLLLAISFRDFSAGARGCLIAAALVCALLCPPLVLAFFFALTLAVASAARLHAPALAAAKARRPYICRPTLRGPPAR